MKEILHILQEWDQRHTEPLKEIYDQYHAHSDFFPQLVNWTLSAPDLQVPCTWLIKYHYDQKGSLEGEWEEALILTCQELKDWQSQLHLLQLLPQFSLQETYLPQLEGFVRKNLTAEKPFLRAWAYQGLFECSKLSPALRPELERMCQEALRTEKASVKARVRKIVKQL